VLLVVALGGNALLERGERPDAGVQQRHVRTAARALAPLASEHTLVLCHGNGPQVGVLALESENDPELTHPYPLDALGAQTQGMIGYWLAQELGNEGVAPAVAIVTQTAVDRADPAFGAPTKFVGGGYPSTKPGASPPSTDGRSPGTPQGGAASSPPHDLSGSWSCPRSGGWWRAARR
jgi:carbamate kinase